MDLCQLFFVFSFNVNRSPIKTWVRYGGSVVRAGDVPGVTGHRSGVFDADALGTDDALGAAHRRGVGAALAACA